VGRAQEVIRALTRDEAFRTHLHAIAIDDPLHDRAVDRRQDGRPQYAVDRAQASSPYVTLVALQRVTASRARSLVSAASSPVHA
jgi:hypothetical protein